MKKPVISEAKREAKTNVATSTVKTKTRGSDKVKSSAAEVQIGDWDALMRSIDRQLDKNEARMDALLEYQARKRA